VKLSSRGDYAVRVILELGRLRSEHAVSVTELAERTGIPATYLEQLMLRLRTASVVRSVRGAHGGFLLAREPASITVGEVVRLMDGPLAPTPCASKTAHLPCPSYRCPSEDECVLRDLWIEVRDAISAVVDGTTFGDLLARQSEPLSPASPMYHI
jgi:Rrf2 family transcriptional regulator, cysteine metabolism repressor